MKLVEEIFEFQFPRNLCLTQVYTQPNRQVDIFQKLSNRVLNIQNRLNPSNLIVSYEKNLFRLSSVGEIKNIMAAPLNELCPHNSYQCFLFLHKMLSIKNSTYLISFHKHKK